MTFLTTETEDFVFRFYVDGKRVSPLTFDLMNSDINGAYNSGYTVKKGNKYYHYHYRHK